MGEDENVKITPSGKVVCTDEGCFFVSEGEETPVAVSEKDQTAPDHEVSKIIQVTQHRPHRPLRAGAGRVFLRKSTQHRLFYGGAAHASVARLIS